MPRSRILALAFVSLALVACDSSSRSGFSGFPPPIVVNTGLAAGQVFGTGLLRVVAASEADQNLDLTGDGDRVDFVAQILDMQFKTLVDTGLALDPALLERAAAADEVPLVAIAANDDIAVFVVSELATGSDANDNGVSGELTTWVVDRATGRLRSLPLAHGHVVLASELAVLTTFVGRVQTQVFDASDDSLTSLPEGTSLLLAREDVLAFGRPEVDGHDWNGDGDSADTSVLHLYDPLARELVNTGWATQEVHWAGGWLGFLVNELEQGRADLDGLPGDGVAFVAVHPVTRAERVPHLAASGFLQPADDTARFFVRQDEERIGDRNGDGDALDRVPVLYSASGDRTREPRLASDSLLYEAGPFVGITVDEYAQDLDLDGDGELRSLVLHVVDDATGTIHNLGFFGLWIAGFGEHLVGLRTEHISGDLNGDGDTFDSVLLDWSERHPGGRTVRVAVGSFDGAWSDQGLVTVSELFQSTDQNQDGDRDDVVLAQYDASTGVVRSLRLGVVSMPAPTSSFASTAVLVSEQAQGADLNGDTDLSDQVLHTVQFLQPID